MTLAKVGFLMLAVGFSLGGAWGASPEIEKLPNGLTVAWLLDDSLPVVDLSVFIKSGFVEDTRGKSGTAELLTELLGRREGIQHHFADARMIHLGFHGLAGDGQKGLEALKQVVVSPDWGRVKDAEIDRVRAHLVDRRAHVAEGADTLAQFTLQKLLTDGTAYARGEFVSPSELEAVKRDDLIRFHKRYFDPRHSVLLVVGRADPAVLKPLIADYFGNQWKSDPGQDESQASVRQREFSSGFKNPIKKPGTVVIVDRPGATQAVMRVGFVVQDVSPKDRKVWAVISAFFGDFFGSRLNALLRDKLGLTYAVSSAFSFRPDFSTFTVSSSSRNQLVGQLVGRTMESLQRMKKAGVTEQEVKASKVFLKGSATVQNSNLNELGFRWAANWGEGLLGESLRGESLDDELTQIDEVTVEKVRTVLEKSLDQKKYFIVVTGDADEVQKGLKAAEIKSFRRVSLRELGLTP